MYTSVYIYIYTHTSTWTRQAGVERGAVLVLTVAGAMINNDIVIMIISIIIIMIISI